jgi:hypothetical protein
MDDLVLQALQRWPDVPAVHGWLSLDARGRWKLHPNGGANGVPPEPGEPIAHPGLNAFINRNYAGDGEGRWFFQNGPQRVYVRLDAAPYVVRLADDGAGLQTHTGQGVSSVLEWLLDDEGHLYMRTPLGPARFEDRDLPALLARLRSGADTLLEALEAGATRGTLSYPALPPAPWRRVSAEDLARELNLCEHTAP